MAKMRVRTADGGIAEIPLGGGGSDTSELESRVETLERRMNNLSTAAPSAISITSFEASPSLAEYGDTVTAVTLSWGLSRTPATVILDGETLTPTATSLSFSGLSLTMGNSKAWTLAVTDADGGSAQRTAGVTFCNGVYFGVKTEPAAYDGDFILGLTKQLSAYKVSSFEVTAGEGEYIYYCLPARLGDCSFYLDGLPFEGGLQKVYTLEFTNAFGYPESYDVYRSDNPTLGHTIISVT